MTHLAQHWTYELLILQERETFLWLTRDPLGNDMNHFSLRCRFPSEQLVQQQHNSKLKNAAVNQMASRGGTVRSEACESTSHLIDYLSKHLPHDFMVSVACFESSSIEKDC